MKLIIIWQSKRDMTEALIQMNSKEGKKAFDALENRCRYAYNVIFAFETLFYAAIVFGQIPLYSKLYVFHATGSDFVIISGLLYSYYSLTSLL